jgi:ribose-phosphate pyrophosphokinase
MRSAPKPAALYTFARHAELGRRLARRLGWSFRQVKVRSFPDGESLVQVVGPACTGRVVLLSSLDQPNQRIVECILAAATLRERGARSVALLAPYLGYMRQDTAFHPGEAVSQRVMGELLGRYFERVYSVAAHLHRTPRLSDVFHVPAVNLSAVPVIVTRLRGARDTVLVGPDAESEQWVRRVAEDAELPYVVGSKRRLGDRDVTLSFPRGAPFRGKRVVIIDDIVSSGHTVLEAVRAIRRHRPAAVELLVVHALCSPEAEAALHSKGVRVVSSNSVPHSSNAMDLAPVLAAALGAAGRTSDA